MSLFILVQPALRAELRAALFRARESGKPASALAVPFELAGRQRAVDLRVLPAAGVGGKLRVGHRSSYMVWATWSWSRAGDTSTNPSHSTSSASSNRPNASSAKKWNKTHFPSEELKASNEELQAMNEELRSATEELETGREELHSINEELSTVNAELKSNVDDLFQSNSHLQSLMGATRPSLREFRGPRPAHRPLHTSGNAAIQLDRHGRGQATQPHESPNRNTRS